MAWWGPISDSRILAFILSQVGMSRGLCPEECFHRIALAAAWSRLENPMSLLFTIAKSWKKARRSSTEEWIEMWCTYTMDYYSAIKE